MTELGHGSNVAALQTECVLDTNTDEWVCNTPDDSAIKWYGDNSLSCYACTAYTLSRHLNQPVHSHVIRTSTNRNSVHCCFSVHSMLLSSLTQA